MRTDSVLEDAGGDGTESVRAHQRMPMTAMVLRVFKDYGKKRLMGRESKVNGSQEMCNSCGEEG